jgi:hypothetical protein
MVKESGVNEGDERNRRGGGGRRRRSGEGMIKEN